MARRPDISLREKIYEKVRDDITFGRLSPGERITEATLAEEFSTSRSPIREAIQQLVSEGFLTLERNKGISVSKLSPKEVVEIYDIRILLEPYAARQSAEKASDADIVYLKELNEDMQKAEQVEDRGIYIEKNKAFHSFFSDNCSNGNLRHILDVLKRRIYRYYYIAISDSIHFASYREDHIKMIEACEKHDGEMAHQYMKQHLEYIKKNIKIYLKTFPSA